MRKLLLLISLCVFTLPGYAKDKLELDETSIQGASELPKVLYIVPWKKNSPDDKSVKMRTMVDDVMAPVDKSVLKRKIRYYKAQQTLSDK